MEDSLQEAKQFWRVAADFPPNKEDVYPAHKLAQEFDKIKGKRVLEYGCGGGSDAMSYLRRGNAVWAADIVPGNVDMTIERARQSNLSKTLTPVRLEQSAPLPLPSEFFNVVSSHGVVHHIQDPTPVVQEFFRVLAPGGLLYVMLYSEALYERVRMRTEELMGEGDPQWRAFGRAVEGCPYARSYTVEEGWDLLTAAGFEPINTFEYENSEFRTFRAKRA